MGFMSTNETKSKEVADEIDFRGCPATGVGGYHSGEYADEDEGCIWCGATHRQDD